MSSAQVGAETRVPSQGRSLSRIWWGWGLCCFVLLPGRGSLGAVHFTLCSVALTVFLCLEVGLISTVFSA